MLSGDPADIEVIDRELQGLFPDDTLLQRWLAMAPEKVAFQGLPARICWLGYGDRARAGLAMNELVRTGRVSAPVVIGRDHLDSGSVASPYRETEAMRDGSDAIADWPILNALLNTAAGATWVSVHHGGGVGIGNSIHSGMVVLADGTADAAARLERVLTADPGTGVMRHADAGYPEALDAAREGGLDLPSVRRARERPLRRRRHRRPSRDRSADSRPRAGGDSGGRRRPAPRREPPGRRVSSRTRSCSAATGRIEAVGPMARAPDRARAAIEEIDGRGLSAIPGLVDCHTHACFGGDRVNEFSLRAGGASYEELHAAGGGILSTVRATRAAGEDAARRARRSSTASWMRAHGTTTFEGKSGYGLDRETELAQLRAVRAAGGVPTWLGAHTVPPEFDDADAYLDFLLAEVLPEAAALAEAADVFLERGSFDAAAGAAVPRGMPRRGAGAAAARRPVHGVRRDRARDRPRRTFGRSPRGDRARRRRSAGSERRHGRAAACERALPRAADAAGARAGGRRRADRACDRLQPRAVPSATACRSCSRSPAPS